MGQDILVSLMLLSFKSDLIPDTYVIIDNLVKRSITRAKYITILILRFLNCMKIINITSCKLMVLIICNILKL